jgi:hypothetical protein
MFKIVKTGHWLPWKMICMYFSANFKNKIGGKVFSMNFTKGICVVAAALCLVIWGGCRKDANTTGSLHLHIPTYIGLNQVDTLGKFYNDQNGRPMAIKTAQCFISDISLQNATGAWQTIPHTYLIKLWNKDDYVIPNVPVGNYTGIRFNVGIDQATDTTLPALYSPTGPDSLLANAANYYMYYGWQWEGYVFMDLEGTADISAAHDGSRDTSFVYIIGSNSGTNLKTVTLPPRTFSVTADQSATVNIICDYGRLLEGINMTVTTNQRTDTYFTNTATAAMVADSFPNMFRYQ